MAQHSEHSLILQVDGCLLQGFIKTRATFSSSAMIFPLFGQLFKSGQVSQSGEPIM